MEVGKTTSDIRGGMRTGRENNDMGYAAVCVCPAEGSCDDSRAKGGKNRPAMDHSRCPTVYLQILRSPEKLEIALSFLE